MENSIKTTSLLKIIISCFLLNACSTYSSQFECASGKGESCKSISKVNHLVSEGALAAQRRLEINKENVRVWQAPKNGNLEGDYYYIDISESNDNNKERENVRQNS